MMALWNKLVEIDRAHCERYRAATADDPLVSKLREQYDIATAEIDVLIAKRKMARQAARKPVPTPDLDEEITAAKARRKTVAAQLAAATKVARALAKPALDVLENDRRQRVKEVRRPGSSGLYWGNYNAVCAAYDRARSAIFKHGGELLFRRHDDEGRLVNQIQSGITAGELFAGSHSQLKIACRPARDRGITKSGRLGECACWVLTATVYRTSRKPDGNRTVTWPLIMHRPLPDGSRIKEVVIHCRRLEPHWRWQVTLTCDLPAPILPAPDGHVTAIDIGWRKPNEGLRVATVMREESAAEFVVLPYEIIERLERPEHIRSHRDTMLKAFSARAFLAAVPWHEASAEMQVVAEKLRKAPKISAARLALLAITWRTRPDFKPDDFARLEEWRKRDKHLWLYEANGRDQAARWRIDHYRNTARRAVDKASVLILERFDLAKAARIDSMDNPLNGAARHQRMLAAVHVLRQWIINYAAKYNVPMRWHTGVSTWICSECANRLGPRDPARLVLECSPCGHVFDQDVEACRNMLAADAVLSAKLSDGSLWVRIFPPSAQFISIERLERRTSCCLVVTLCLLSAPLLQFRSRRGQFWPRAYRRPRVRSSSIPCLIPPMRLSRTLTLTPWSFITAVTTPPM
jgi:hypothetical protein